MKNAMTKYEKETVAYGVALVGSLCALITLAWAGGHAILTTLFGGG